MKNAGRGKIHVMRRAESECALVGPSRGVCWLGWLCSCRLQYCAIVGCCSAFAGCGSTYSVLILVVVLLFPLLFCSFCALFISLFFLHTPKYYQKPLNKQSKPVLTDRFHPCKHMIMLFLYIHCLSPPISDASYLQRSSQKQKNCIQKGCKNIKCIIVTYKNYQSNPFIWLLCSAEPPHFAYTLMNIFAVEVAFRLLLHFW